MNANENVSYKLSKKEGIFCAHFLAPEVTATKEAWEKNVAYLDNLCKMLIPGEHFISS